MHFPKMSCLLNDNAPIPFFPLSSLWLKMNGRRVKGHEGGEKVAQEKERWRGQDKHHTIFYPKLSHTGTEQRGDHHSTLIHVN